MESFIIKFAREGLCTLMTVLTAVIQAAATKPKLRKKQWNILTCVSRLGRLRKNLLPLLSEYKGFFFFLTKQTFNSFKF